jgi:hypothetical protein
LSFFRFFVFFLRRSSSSSSELSLGEDLDLDGRLRLRLERESESSSSSASEELLSSSLWRFFDFFLRFDLLRFLEDLRLDDEDLERSSSDCEKNVQR